MIKSQSLAELPDADLAIAVLGGNWHGFSKVMTQVGVTVDDKPTVALEKAVVFRRLLWLELEGKRRRPFLRVLHQRYARAMSMWERAQIMNLAKIIDSGEPARTFFEDFGSRIMRLPQ